MTNYREIRQHLHDELIAVDRKFEKDINDITMEFIDTLRERLSTSCLGSISRIEYRLKKTDLQEIINMRRYYRKFEDEFRKSIKRMNRDEIYQHIDDYLRDLRLDVNDVLEEKQRWLDQQKIA